jgi:hypothetical protein
MLILLAAIVRPGDALVTELVYAGPVICDTWMQLTRSTFALRVRVSGTEPRQQDRRTIVVSRISNAASSADVRVRPPIRACFSHTCLF